MKNKNIIELTKPQLKKFWEENSDVKIKIPMENKIDSLNVSVSCAIILYEINRQSKSEL